MNKNSIAYRVIAKTAAVMLVFSLLMPSALKAKQLVDFCMMEMSHHNTADDTHDCCVLDLSNLEGDQKNPDNCETAQICACAVDTSLTNNQFKVPTAKSSDVILSRMGFNFMVTSPDEFIYKEYLAAAGETHPPLYLLYDTFLN